jgi:hypothetical protein
MHTLNLTDGTTTISLTASGVMLRSYTPTAPQSEQPITESIDLMVYGANTSAMQTKINDIERMLDAAKRRATTHVGARVYLQFQPINDAVLWRSEILSGLLVLDNKALTVFGQAQVRVALILTRVPYWEGAEVELQLSTSNQTAATGGRTIRNHDDSGTGDDNWVQIAAAQVGGVLPAPARVTLTNTTGSAQAYTKVWMAVNAFSDPANFAHMLEGESRSGGIGTVTADANCSNGSRLDVSLGAGVGGSINFWINSTQLQRTQGRRFRLLARFAANTGTPTITPRLVDDTGNVTFWRGESVILATQGQHIADLGTVTLPVGGWGADYGGVTLSLGCRGAMNAQLDFVQLTPLDAYRYVELFGYAVANNAALVDDGIGERTYILTSGVAYPYAAPRGAPLLLYPNTTQRIIFLHQTSTAAPIANAFSVRVYYRPRRLTL